MTSRSTFLFLAILFFSISATPIDDILPKGEVVLVEAGARTTFFVKSDGTLIAGGDSYEGEFGRGTQASNKEYGKILTGVRFVTAGDYHTLITKTDGTVWATGFNAGGQLFNSKNQRSLSWIKVMDDAKVIEAGYLQTFIIKTDGSLWASGERLHGKLGDGTEVDQAKMKDFTPVKVLDGAIAVSTGRNHTLVIRQDGTLWGAGSNEMGQLGLPLDFKGTTKFIKLKDSVTAIAADGDVSMYVKSDSSAWISGDNYLGQQGNKESGKDKNVFGFHQVGTGVRSVACGTSHSLYLKNDGTLWAAGSRARGQLGTLIYQTEDKQASPNFTKVQDEVRFVSAGALTTFIIKNDGTVMGCGDNDRWQLGTDKWDARGEFMKIKL